MREKTALKVISCAFTIGGLVILATGDFTNGFLSMILGELIGISKHY